MFFLVPWSLETFFFFGILFGFSRLLYRPSNFLTCLKLGIVTRQFFLKVFSFFTQFSPIFYRDHLYILVHPHIFDLSFQPLFIWIRIDPDIFIFFIFPVLNPGIWLRFLNPFIFFCWSTVRFYRSPFLRTWLQRLKPGIWVRVRRFQKRRHVTKLLPNSAIVTRKLLRTQFTFIYVICYHPDPLFILFHRNFFDISWLPHILWVWIDPNAIMYCIFHLFFLTWTFLLHTIGIAESFTYLYLFLQSILYSRFLL